MRDALILTGPTGSGKTALALELAERLGAEIIALDSMTLYRGLDIGTAKPTREEQARVRHHLVDALDPHESANVAWWHEQAQAACQDIRTRGRRPLFVGGTPMYLKALLYGLFDAMATDLELRAALEAEAARHGPRALHAKLQSVDPIAAARLHPNDIRRVVRALEVHTLTGQPISEHQKTWWIEDTTEPNPKPPNPIPAVMLDWPREKLYSRINARVEAMMAAGWVDECRELRHQNLSREARQAVGYREIFEWLEAPSADFQSVMSAIQTRTRQFAKRQLTWFRKLPVTAVRADESKLAECVSNAWNLPL